MSTTQLTAQVVSFFLALIFVVEILDICAFAYYDAVTFETHNLSDYYYGLLAERAGSNKIRTFLRENGLALNSITDDELDYIVLLASQCSSFYDTFTPGLVLAMIAYESRFDSGALSSHDARGLMQIVPYYHSDRVMQFVDEGQTYSKDLLDDPRLNIMTGCDYLNDILTSTNNDLAYSLMIYNQGQTSAAHDYKFKGYVSEYARDIIATANQIDEVINKALVGT